MGTIDQEMNLTDKANQLKKRIAPGIWEDKNDKTHFSIPELLQHVGLDDTPENREEAKRMLVELFKELNPNCKLLYRESPTDDGEDLR